MPFTPSHVAAIVPLRRLLPPAALTVGALVPDLPYYVPTPFSSETTHAWWGAPLADLPVGLAVLLLFQLLVRTPLTSLAPAGLRARLPERAPSPRFAATAAAVLAGVVTHLAWDAFTHVDGFAVVHWPIMRVSVAGVHRLFNVVMYVSSLGGLAAIAIWFAVWYRRTPARPGRPPGVPARVRVMVAAACTAAAVAGAVLQAHRGVAAVSLYDLVRCVLLGGIEGVAAVLACYVAAWHAGARPRSRPAAESR
ncbi:DUF4184 family protein [Sphaerisporangium fuscum]|uniref:DUF4184 family protein n=1 Tax=Sphaerisporangium fuscum TaxID=2835868 RepID=UPI001BDC73F3|nr:DUF4184 family protein [Sphaerisporangium fuscum]